jgi:hypothetical protein
MTTMAFLVFLDYTLFIIWNTSVRQLNVSYLFILPLKIFSPRETGREGAGIKIL